MKTHAKRLLAILLSLSMVLSLCYIPAFAATADSTITLSLLFGTGTSQGAATSELSVGEGSNFYVFAHFDGQPTTEEDAVKAGSVCVAFDTERLTYSKQATLAKFGGGAAAGSVAADGYYVFGFSGDAVMMSIDDEDTIVASGNLFRLQFTAKQAMDNVADYVYLTESFTASDSSIKTTYLQDANDTKFPIAGIPMVMGELTLTPASVTVNGTLAESAVTSTPSLASSGGSAISLDNVNIEITKNGNTYTWFENGTITVPNDAEDGDYTVTATPNGEGLNGSASATLTVARAAAAPASTSALPASVALPTGDDDVSVALSAVDQFGGAMTSGVTYALKGEPAGVTIDGSTVKVSKAAKSNSYTANELTVEYTATANNVTKEGSFTITREAPVVNPSSINIQVDVENDTIVIPSDDSSVTATFTVTAEDQYGDVVTADVTTWAINEGKVDSVNITSEGTITVTKAVAADITDSRTMKVTVTIGGNHYDKTITVKRADPVPTTIEVTGGPSETVSIPADGASDETTAAFSATVKDQYDTAIDDAAVTWAISDVKVDGESVALTDAELKLEGSAAKVANAAKDKIAAGKTATVTVAATVDNTNVSATKDFSLARAASQLTTVTVTDENGGAVNTLTIPVEGSKQYAFKASGADQYGEPMEANCTWSLEPTDAVSVNASSGVVTVTSDATADSTYTLKATASGVVGSLEFKVVKINITWPALTNQSFVYGGTWGEFLVLDNSGSAAIDGNAVPGTFRIVYPNSAAESAVPDAGDYQYDVEFRSTDGVYTVLKGATDVTVSKRSVTPTIGTIEAQEYTGAEIKPTVSVTWSDNLQLAEDTDYTVAYSNNTNVGSAGVTLNTVDTSNYTFNTGNTASFTIDPLEAELAWSGHDAQHVYDGVAANVTATVSNLKGSDDCAVTVSGGDATDAGTHTATATALSNTNYKLPDIKTQDYTIAKKPLTISKVTLSAEKVYDGTADIDSCTFVFEGVVGSDNVSATAEAVWTSPNAGTSTVKLTGITLNNTNYTIDEGANGITVDAYLNENPTEIAQAAVNAAAIVEQSLKAKTIVAEGSTEEKSVTMVGYVEAEGEAGDVTYTIDRANSDSLFGSDETASISGSTLTVKIPAASAKEKDQTAKVRINLESENYKPASVEVTFVFKEKESISEDKFTFISERNYDATEDYNFATYTENPEIGGWTYQYQKSGETTWTPGLPTDVGEYVVKAVYEDDVGEYGHMFESEQPLTIKAVPVTIAWTYNAESVYGESAPVTAEIQSGVLDADKNSVTVSVADGDKTDAGTHTATASLEGAKSANYTVSNPTQDYTINPRNVSIESVVVEGKTYDGKTAVSGMPVVNVKGVLEDDKTEAAIKADFAWTSANAGTNTVALTNIRFEGAKAANYTIDESGTFTVDAKIDKASLIVTAKNASIGYGYAAANEGVEYSGFVNGETEAVLKGSLTYAYIASDGTTPYKAGSDVADYSIIPSGYTEENYAISYQNGTLTVTPRPIKFAWSNVSTFVYNGSEQSPTATVTEKYGSDDVTVVVGGGARNVGSHTASATELAGAKAGNYSIPTDAETKDFTITPVEVTINGITAAWDSENDSVKLSGGEVANKLGNDEVTVDLSSCAPTVADGAFGENVPVTLTSDPALTGADAGNYTLKANGWNAITVNVPQKNVEVATDMGETTVDHSAVDYTNPTVKDAVDQVEGMQLDTESGSTEATENKNAIEQAMTDVAAQGETAADQINAADSLANLTSLASDTSDKIIAVVPTLSVTTTAVTTDENDPTKVESVTVNVAVEAQKVATTENAYSSSSPLELYDENAQNSDTANAKVVGSEPVEVKNPITLTIPNPFGTTVTQVYIRCNIDGKEIETKVDIVGGKIPVRSTAGLAKDGSDFELSTVSKAKFAIGEYGYQSLQDAVDMVANNGTITVLQDAADNATVSRELAFTLDPNGFTFSGSINAGNGYERKVEGDVYTFTRKSTTGGGSGGGGGGGSSTSSSVTVGAAENGSATLSQTIARAGDTVTVTGNPNKGYQLASVTVKDSNGKVVPTSKNADGSYSFTMPSGGVTVTPVFEKTPDASKFIDVPANSFFADAVDWAVANGVTKGTSAITFSPDAPCTRAEAVTFLYRAAGEPEIEYTNRFTDVSADAFYAKAVAWAVENGVTNGTATGSTFSPDMTCTRAQIVTFLYRFRKGTPAMNSFIDVPTDAYYASAVGWAAKNGITKGTNLQGTMFSPDADCTRSQIVTFLYRDLGK